ncbi:MAG: 23S rRNA (adenine(2503)-C(2))-methyltransferase RlmN [SAR86 cluster bacterium]|nr:23S rRNA (adenine(2503)-C(2))-methyltransferase RlmN [SAR86 cluster bacterium]
MIHKALISSNNSKINLLGLTYEELEKNLILIGEKKYKARQIFKWLHKKRIYAIDEMTDLSKTLRENLKKSFFIKVPEVLFEEISEDKTRKWVVSVGNDNHIELVMIPEGARSTLCISSQVGCAVDCSFCATGKEGFSRNLTLDEIIGQLWVAENSFKNSTKKNITNVVMMGMGEPLLNFENVVNAMNIMMDDNAYGLSKRKVTLSTSGLVPQLDKLSTVSNASLAISLHAPNDELRNDLVPINKKYPINMLLESAKKYMDNCGDKRVMTIEYILINEINDSLLLANELADLLKNIPCKINLIPFNPFPKSNYKRPSGNRVKRFQEILKKNGYITTIRSTRGDDIFAACGQLVGQVKDITRKQERTGNINKIDALNISS